jgi:hypothetical protein
MKLSIPIVLSYILLRAFGSPMGLFPAEEKIIAMGGEHSWKTAERRMGITELQAVRPWPVLALDSGLRAESESRIAAGGPLQDGVPRSPGEAALDLSLSFDEASPALFSSPGGAYSVSAVPESAGTFLRAVGPGWARMGGGAAFFSTALTGSSTGTTGDQSPAGP